MEANEFRIWNYINDQHGVVSKIFEITDYNRVVLGEGRIVTDLQNCEYIPLTEEWLLKFGFESNDGTKYNPSDEYESQFEYTLDSGISHRYFICHPTKGWVIKLGDYDDELEIKYVHQLQNLFFALKGKELTIKS